jgi:endonuclease/exonuclease/phosphatase family metal-dependent hydrolase
LRLPRIGFRFPMYLPGPRKVVMVHEEPRAAVIGHLETPSGPLVVVNTHLSYVPGWGRLQLRHIRRDLAAVTGRVVLMGDLNMTDPKPAAITGYASLARHPTFPLDPPTQQLDHILARGSWAEVSDSRAVRLPLSDHLALSVDLVD